MDLTAVGGQAAAAVTATVVQHLSATGAVLWEWNAFDHFAITDLALSERTGPAVNFTHGNGLGFDSDSNLILGFRSLDEVTKVDRVTGAVIWRFGGLANEFTILGDPKGSFQRQHGVRWAGPGPSPDAGQRPVGAEPVRAVPARHRRNDGHDGMGVHRRPDHLYQRRREHPVPRRRARDGVVRPRAGGSSRWTRPATGCGS